MGDLAPKATSGPELVAWLGNPYCCCGSVECLPTIRIAKAELERLRAALERAKYDFEFISPAVMPSPEHLGILVQPIERIEKALRGTDS